MSTALETLAALTEDWHDDEGVAESLRSLFVYLRQCYGPTPKEAIASDEMSEAAAAITRLLRTVPFEDLVHEINRTKLPIPVRHWCLSLALQDIYGARYDEWISFRIGPSGAFGAYVDDVKVATLSELSANIYRTHFEDEILTVEAQVAPGFLFSEKHLSLHWVAWQTSEPAQDTGEYAGYHLFGHVFAKGRYLRFRRHVPPTYPKTSIVLRAELTVDGKRMTTSMSLGYRGASHLARVRGMRWNREGFSFRADRRAIAVTPFRAKESFRKEILLNLAIIARVINRKTPARHFQAVFVRILYWATRSRFEAKNIWLLHDKMYSSSDCGEYMYWYLHENAPEVTPVFAVNRDSAETPRLRQQKARLVYPGSIRLALYYLNARVIFTTHPNPATTTGFTQFGVFLRDLNNAPIVCIQHGLSMQELGRSMHQGHAGIERYYCASKYEVGNIGTPEYGYEPEQLVLTGIPRFDGLPTDSERVIMISPTWRPEYAAPSPGENNRRPVNEDFLNSLYFDRFSALLTSRGLLDAAKNAGFKIRFMIHPTLATNHGYFREGLAEVAAANGVNELVDDVVKVVAAGIDTSYDQELKRARLLVTDYSGIQYDFAYMRKSLIYFHDEDMPPQYGNGAMKYESMGFGPIAASIGSLTQLLIEALARDCVVDETFASRYETFFQFDDRSNRARIHEDVTEWLDGKSRVKA